MGVVGVCAVWRAVAVCGGCRGWRVLRVSVEGQGETETVLRQTPRHHQIEALSLGDHSRVSRVDWSRSTGHVLRGSRMPVEGA